MKPLGFSRFVSCFALTFTLFAFGSTDVSIVFAQGLASKRPSSSPARRANPPRSNPSPGPGRMGGHPAPPPPGHMHPGGPRPPYYHRPVGPPAPYFAPPFAPPPLWLDPYIYINRPAYPYSAPVYPVSPDYPVAPSYPVVPEAQETSSKSDSWFPLGAFTVFNNSVNVGQVVFLLNKEQSNLIGGVYQVTEESSCTVVGTITDKSTGEIVFRVTGNSNAFYTKLDDLIEKGEVLLYSAREDDPDRKIIGTLKRK